MPRPPPWALAASAASEAVRAQAGAAADQFLSGAGREPVQPTTNVDPAVELGDLIEEDLEAAWNHSPVCKGLSQLYRRDALTAGDISEYLIPRNVTKYCSKKAWLSG